MKKVLVPLASIKLTPETIAPIDGARQTYIKKLIHYNLLALFVSPLFEKEAVDELYDLSDGVLCMGGYDIDPVHYGEKSHPKNDTPDKKRDELELYILKKVLEDKKPYLGICRGCQALAIASGGKLYQHVLEHYPNENHSATSYEDLAKISHSVQIIPDTKLFKIINKKKIDVNSAHHQAISKPGKNMKISAVSPEGVVEAIEHTDKNFFCIGIQSHPEALDKGDLEPLFKAFASSV
jgi:putative glutamine amidotransferase